MEYPGGGDEGFPGRANRGLPDVQTGVSRLFNYNSSRASAKHLAPRSFGLRRNDRGLFRRGSAQS